MEERDGGGDRGVRVKKEVEGRKRERGGDWDKKW